MKDNNVNIVRCFFLVGLFALPFVFWPWATIAYEIPKVLFFQRWVEVLGGLGVLGILGKLGKQKTQEGDLKLVFGVVVFLLIAFVSSLLGVNFLKSLVGNYYRGDGLLTLLHLTGLFFFLSLFWEESWEKPTKKIIALSSILLSAWTIFLGIKYFFYGNWGNWGDWGGAVMGKGVAATFGQPNFLAGYLLITLPFVANFIKEKRLLGIIGLIGQIGAIFLTGSRATAVGVLIFFSGWLILKITKEKKQGKIFLLMGIIAFTVISLLYSFSPREPFFEENVEEKTRERIGVKGINAFLKRPILGWGVANFDYAFEASIWPIKLNNDIYVDKAHSNFFEILVTEGLLGLGAYLGLIILFLRKLLKVGEGKKRDFEKSGIWLYCFLLFLFHSQTNIISINEEMFFWLILGIAASRPEIVKSAKQC